MAETKDYDLGELLKGNIDSVQVKFPELNNDHLMQLAALENGPDGAKRKGLLEAIHNELFDRADEAEAAAEAKANAEAAAAKNLPPEKPADNAGAPTAADKAEVASALASTGARATPAEKAAAKRAPKAGAARGATAGKVGFGAAKTNPMAGEANTVVFADDDGNRLADIPPLEFGAKDFVPAAVGPKGAFELHAPIRFEVSGPRSAISAAWLVDGGGKGALVAKFIAPLIVGGGRAAEIPKGSLKFEPETDDAKAERTRKAA